MRDHNKLIIAYFALIAIAVGGLQALHIKANMQGILFAMAAAGIVLFVIKLIIGGIRHKMERFGLSGRQWMAVMAGAPAEVVGGVVDAGPGQYIDDYEDDRPAQRALMPYYGDDEDEEEGEELAEEIIEPDGLYLAGTFQPSIHSILGSRMLITGITRSGKSNAIAVIIEEIARYTLPLLICDTEDEYAGLVDRQYMPHAFMAGAPGAGREVSEEIRRYYIPVDEEGAFEFGKGIMDGHLQVILNLKSYPSDDDAARVMCKVIEGINAWQQARPNKDRVPCLVVLEEGPTWLPQQLTESNVSKETQSLLHHTFFGTIVRKGGKRGFGLIVAAQRIVELDKRCLQSSWKFLFMQTEEIDVKRYEKLGIPQEAVISLVQGECFLFCPQALGFRVRLRERTSPHLAHTPGLEQLARNQNRARAMRDMVARRGYAATSNALRDVSSMPPLSLTKGIRPVAVAPVTETPASFEEDEEDEDGEEKITPPKPGRAPEMPPALDAKHQAALKLWSKGRRTHRDVAAAMTAEGNFGKVSDNEAYRLLIDLDEMGYITRPKKVKV